MDRKPKAAPTCMALPQRKDIRLPLDHYLGRRSYFLTLCVQNRRRLFLSPEIVSVLLSILSKLSTSHCFDLYAYCFMPDHLHLLLNGKNSACDLQKFVRQFNGQSCAVLRKSGIHAIWQKGFYDHILRTGEEQSDSAAYIFENPIRAGLSKDVYHYSFSGSLVFDVHKFQLPERAGGVKPPLRGAR
jgi:putative transposase